MFDISWTEFLLIGVVALVVIGPKELPGVLRTLGQWTRKVRGMANDFQNQFQEAMREAEMADLKKQVDDMAHGFKDFDPLKGVRDDVEAMGKDIEHSLGRTPGETPRMPDGGDAGVTDAPTGAPAVASDPAGLPAAEPAAALPAAEPTAAEPATAVETVERSDLEVIGADTASKPAAPAAEAAATDGTGRTA
jgi:sec-independent protein translocase protein TatB